MSRSLRHPDWVRRLNLFGDAVGDPGALVPLDADDLLATARATTGLSDIGDAEWSGWDTAFRAFIASVDLESKLHLLGRVVTRAEVTRMLQTWLRLQGHWAATPALATERLVEPLFVVGPPRTGTTILLELLALDPSLRAPMAWEAVQPLRRLSDPVADRSERRRLAESEQELWADIHPEFMTMHELATDLPCECVHFLAYDFAGPYWSMLYDTPSFTGWQLEHLESLERVYRLHRRMLQTFQYAGDPRDGSAGEAGPSVPRRWLLKSPAHVSTLPQLFAEYPDALVIHTHRDPRKFIASLASLLGVLRFMRSDVVDLPALGPMMEVTYQIFLEGAIAQRADGSVPSERIVDSHFLDLIADPVAQVHGLYDQLGFPWPTGHDIRIREYLANKPQGKHGAHAYTFDSVGLDEAHVRATFTNYVAHYGITEE